MVKLGQVTSTVILFYDYVTIHINGLDFGRISFLGSFSISIGAN